MVEELKIIGSSTGDEGYCIVCGEPTKHRHSYSDNQLKTVPVCHTCCKVACNGIHKTIDLKIKEYHCDQCRKNIPEEKVARVGDMAKLCPTCNSPVKPVTDPK